MILQGEAERRNNYYYEFDRSQGAIGQGGMGIVFKGRMVDESTGASRDVAIKEIITEGSMDEQALVVNRAKREASICLNNDNVVEMMGFVEVHEKKLNISKTRYYVVSEFLDGVTLDKVLEGDCRDYLGEFVDYAVELHKQLEENREETAARITRNLLSAIMALHDLGYIHRDIDPSNIMVTRDGHIKLFDLGIALKPGNGDSLEFQKLAGAAVGKAKYSAPELISGQLSLQNFTTDTYAIGVIFYQLITGHLPFEGNDFEVQQGHLKKKPDLRGIKSSLYRNVLAKALEKKQNKRFQSSASMRSALDGIDPVPHPRMYRYYAILGTSIVAFLIFLWLRPGPIPPPPPPPPPIEIESVESYCDKDIDSIWKILKRDPEHPGALYAIAGYAEKGTHKTDSRFKDFHDDYYVKNSYNKLYINDKEKGFTSVRFRFISLCRAYESLKSGKYEISGKELILSKINAMEGDLLNGGNNLVYNE